MTMYIIYDRKRNNLIGQGKTIWQKVSLGGNLIYVPLEELWIYWCLKSSDYINMCFCLQPSQISGLCSLQNAILMEFTILFYTCIWVFPKVKLQLESLIKKTTKSWNAFHIHKWMWGEGPERDREREGEREAEREAELLVLSVYL